MKRRAESGGVPVEKKNGDRYQIIQGDCLEVMKAFENNSVDAIVTDPPAGIAFMGKAWDKDKGGRDAWIAWMSEVAAECLRVIKPGGHALVWALPRTSHWTATAWEDAGWEVRDKVYFCFGSGFPKSLSVSKALDRMAGAEREVVDVVKKKPSASSDCNAGWVRPWAEGKTTMDITAPATEAAKQWDGWYSALKPAIEEWHLLRKPLDGTIAENVLKHGVGGLNVDGIRVGTEENCGRPQGTMPHPMDWGKKSVCEGNFTTDTHASGRYPSHLFLDGSPEVVGLFPESSVTGVRTAARFFHHCPFDDEDREFARLIYGSKASKQDRDEGCEGLEKRRSQKMGNGLKSMVGHPSGNNGNTSTEDRKARNHHPTCKSTALMVLLCRMITPKDGGIILDPFAGSGSTGKAAIREGFQFIGIEQDPEYVEIARARIKHEAANPSPVPVPKHKRMPKKEVPTLFL